MESDYIPGTWTSKDTIVTKMRIDLSSECYYFRITLKDDLILGTNDCEFLIDVRCGTLDDVRWGNSSIEITTLDKKNQIISGRFDDIDFHFGDSIVHITKGQFDINYGKNF